MKFLCASRWRTLLVPSVAEGHTTGAIARHISYSLAALPLGIFTGLLLFPLSRKRPAVLLLILAVGSTLLCAIGCGEDRHIRSIDHYNGTRNLQPYDHGNQWYGRTLCALDSHRPVAPLDVASSAPQFELRGLAGFGSTSIVITLVHSSTRN